MTELIVNKNIASNESELPNKNISFFTDPLFSKYEDRINDLNIDLYAFASTFPVENNIRNTAYEIILNVDNNEIHEKVKYLFECFEDAREIVNTRDAPQSYLIILENELSKLLKSVVNDDTHVFEKNCEYVTKCLEYFRGLYNENIELFIEASEFINNDAKLNAFFLASRVQNEILIKKVLSLYKDWKDKNDNFLNDKNLKKIYLLNINEYNIELFAEASILEDNIKIGAYEIILTVQNEYLREKASKFITLLKDSDFHQFINKINNFNIELFIEANKFSENESKIAAYNLASIIDNDSNFIKAKEIFDAFRKEKIPLQCFNKSLLKMELIERVQDIRINKTKNTDNLYNTYYNRKVIFNKEIDPGNPLTYENIPECTLCYKGNDLYLRQNYNNKKEIVKLNLSKEGFELLFPGDSLLTFSQGKTGDCYFLSANYSFLNNPLSLERFLNLFSINKNKDVSITFPYNVSIIFKDTKPVLDGTKAVKGSLGWKLLEEAYSAYRNDFLNKHKEPVDAEDVVKHYEDLRSGNPLDVFQYLGFNDTEAISNKNLKDNLAPQDLSNDSLFDKLKNYLIKNNSKTPIITLSTIDTNDNNMENIDMDKEGLVKNHAYTLLKVEGDNLYISNPHNTSGTLKISKDVLNSCFDQIQCCLPSSLIVYSSSNLTLKNNIYKDAYKWWAAKIDKIDDFYKRTLLQFKNLENENHLKVYKAFELANLDPYILLNDIYMFQYFNDINKYNVNCFVEASKIQDEKTRLAAYNIASCIESNDEKDGFLFLLNYLNDHPSDILIDEVFQGNPRTYLIHINKINIGLFLEVAKIPDKETRFRAYEMSYKITSNDKYELALKSIDFLRNNTNLKWNDLIYYYAIGVRNNYNEDFYDKLLDLNDTESISFLYQIASKVNDGRSRQIVLKIYDFLKNTDKLNSINKDMLVTCGKSINNYNLELYGMAFELTEPQQIETALLLASHVQNNNIKTEALRLFSEFKIRVQRLLSDKVFYSFLQNHSGYINDINLQIFTYFSLFENPTLRKNVYLEIATISSKEAEKKFIDVFDCIKKADAENLLADDCFYKYLYKVNKNNIRAFKDALSSTDMEERNLGFYEASHIH